MKFQIDKTVSQKIFINGVEYKSIDEVPPELRSHYEDMQRMITEDKDGNGVADIFENDSKTIAKSDVTKNATTKIISKKTKLGFGTETTTHQPDSVGAEAQSSASNPSYRVSRKSKSIENIAWVVGGAVVLFLVVKFLPF